MSGSTEKKLKKIICVDEKTMRSNKREGRKSCHIVSAWSGEDGYCLGQKAVDEKSNEITAIPKVLAGHSAAMEIAYYAELNFKYFEELLKIEN